MSENLGDNAKKSTEDVNGLAKALKDVLKTTEELKSSNKDFHESLRKTYKEARKEVSDLEKGVESLDKALESVPDTINKDFNKSFNASGKAFEKAFGKKALETVNNLQKKLSLTESLTADQIFSKKDQMGVLKRIKEINKAISNIDDRSIGKGLMRKGAIAKNMASSIGSGWKNRDASQWRDTGGVMTAWGERAQRKAAVTERRGEGGWAKAGGKAMSMAGKASSMGGGALGMASKAMPIAGAIVQGVSMLNDVVNAGNRMFTGGMNDYRAIGGAQTDGDDFVGKAKEFNTLIRDVGRNMELGMEASDWKSMFETMGHAGYSVEGVEDKLGSLEGVMDTTRKTSLALGVSTEVMGEAMVQQSMELGSGLSTMQDGYEEVARSAKAAGIESNKFLNIIQASTLSMGAYGNFTKAAAATLESLSNNAGITQQEADKMTGDVLTMFKGMGSAEKLSFMAMLGKEGEREVVKALKSKIAKIDEQLAGGNLSDEERQRLKAQKTSMNDALDTQGGARSLALANSLEYTDTMPMILKALDNVSQKSGMTREEYLGSEGSHVIAKAIPGMTEEMVEQLKRMIQGDKGSLQPVVGTLNKYMKSIVEGGSATSDKKEEFRNIMGILSKGRSMTEAESVTAKSGISSILSEQGIGDGDIRDLLKLLETDSKSFGKTFTRLLEGNEALVGRGRGADLGASSSGIANARLGATGDETRGMYVDSVGNQDKMIKALTPLESMTEMAKESALWAAASSETAQSAYQTSEAIRKGVFGIYGFLTRTEREDVNVALKTLKDNLAGAKDSEDLLKSYKDLGSNNQDFVKAKTETDRNNVLLDMADDIARVNARKNNTSFDDERLKLDSITADGSTNAIDKFKKLSMISNGLLGNEGLGAGIKANAKKSSMAIAASRNELLRQSGDLSNEQKGVILQDSSYSDALSRAQKYVPANDKTVDPLKNFKAPTNNVRVNVIVNKASEVGEATRDFTKLKEGG